MRAGSLQLRVGLGGQALGELVDPALAEGQGDDALPLRVLVAEDVRCQRKEPGGARSNLVRTRELRRLRLGLRKAIAHLLDGSEIGQLLRRKFFAKVARLRDVDVDFELRARFATRRFKGENARRIVSSLILCAKSFVFAPFKEVNPNCLQAA